MRPLRQKQPLRQQRTFKGLNAQTEKVEKPVQSRREAVKKEEKKKEVRRMEEEDDTSEEELDEKSVEQEDEDESLEDQRQQLRGKYAAETMEELRPNAKLYVAIRDRYQEILKELWKSQNKLDDFGFSNEEKKILNERCKLWLEYFASTAAFRDENVNLFEYIDSFCDTQKFVN